MKIKHVEFDSLNTIHCTIDELPNAMQTILKAYSNKVADINDDAVRKVTKKTTAIVKKSGSYRNRSGKYRKAIRSKVEKSYGMCSGVVYAGNHEYSLTHLLEKGHRLWNSPRRTRAFPHWIKGEQYAQKELPTLIVKGLKG